MCCLTRGRGTCPAPRDVWHSGSAWCVTQARVRVVSAGNHSRLSYSQGATSDDGDAWAEEEIMGGDAVLDSPSTTPSGRAERSVFRLAGIVLLAVAAAIHVYEFFGASPLALG